MLDILFLCCDIGETNALIPVMEKFQVAEESVNFKIMAMGAAIKKLETCSGLEDKTFVLKEVVDTANGRARAIENVAEAIKDLNPLIIISGPASKAQEQLLEAIPAKNTKIVYLDNFNYSVSNPAFETVRGVASIANKIICVSDVVKEQLKELDDLRAKNIKPLDRPSLEKWVNDVKMVDRTSVLKKIGFVDKKTVTFIGGYGPRYDQGVNAAYASAIHMLEDEGYQVHVQHHPNIVKEQPLSTIEAVGMADYVVCYDSTVGFELLFAEKKVIYLQPEGVEPYNNIAIQQGLAAAAHSNEELLNALQLTEKSECKDIYAVLGVPKNSIDAIVSYLYKRLRN